MWHNPEWQDSLTPRQDGNAHPRIVGRDDGLRAWKEVVAAPGCDATVPPEQLLSANDSENSSLISNRTLFAWTVQQWGIVTTPCAEVIMFWVDDDDSNDQTTHSATGLRAKPARPC